VTENLLETRDLKKYFPIIKGLIFSKVRGFIRAVDGVDIAIGRGETFGLVGESGCGKTTLAKLIMLIESPSSGKILFKGEDVYSLNDRGLMEYRSSIQMVCQDPTSSMNPRMRIDRIVSEPLTVKKSHDHPKAWRERVDEVLDHVKLPRRSASLYPHEFSGGQRQRIAIARALAPGPQCIVLDEPVSALDVSIRGQILNLLMKLQEKLGHSYLLIAHDLAMVRYMSQQVGVMYLGKIVELAQSEEFYKNPVHPYTRGLIASILPSHPDMPWKGSRLSGEVPSPINPPSGCRFHPRCSNIKPKCTEIEPPLIPISRNHHVACWMD
jgi:oligopeptide/dipeptide ABC transporter ATP-binding protein